LYSMSGSLYSLTQASIGRNPAQRVLEAVCGFLGTPPRPTTISANAFQPWDTVI
jgi:hypothetical protein